MNNYMHDATRIIAIRHGETDWNVETRMQGHTDIPLNATGRWQAQCVANALADEDISTLYTSDLTRAHATALAIAARVPSRTVIPTTGLRERGFGVFEGKTYAQLDAEAPEAARRWRQRDVNFAPEGGETLVQLRERIARTVDALASQHGGEQIVLVAHGGVLDTLYRLATGQDMTVHRTWDLGNARINRLLWTPEGLTLVGWADAQHLCGDLSS